MQFYKLRNINFTSSKSLVFLNKYSDLPELLLVEEGIAFYYQDLSWNVILQVQNS